MVNGQASRVIYYGVLSLLAMMILSIGVLTSFDKTIPDVYQTIVAALLAYLAGSHVRPPTDDAP